MSHGQEGHPLLFDVSEKHELGRAGLVLAVNFRRIPISGCRRKVENHSQSEARTAILISNRLEITTLEDEVENFLPVKFRQIMISGCKAVENVSTSQRQDRLSFPFRCARKTQTLQRHFKSISFLSSFVKCSSVFAEK